jgi:hypothetical protein
MRRDIYNRLLPFALCTLASSIHNRNPLDYFRCPRKILSLGFLSSALLTHQISTQAFTKTASKNPIVISLQASQPSSQRDFGALRNSYLCIRLFSRRPGVCCALLSQLWLTICLAGLDRASSKDICATGGMGSQSLAV